MFVQEMALQLINVDLDIESKDSLDCLCIEQSAADIHRLHCGPSGLGLFTSLECANSRGNCEPDSAIKKACEVIESLDEWAATEWNAAGHQCFDLGNEAPGMDHRWSSVLRHAILPKLVDLGASIAFTAYPRDKRELALEATPLLPVLHLRRSTNLNTALQ
ncbi:hypothetical protein [Verrucomicrobium spinosum]|nr:hypothetical protein [Verrucomicrobium spinosum]